MYPSSRNLLIAMAATLIAAASLFLGVPGGVARIIGAIALVLVLPGYALGRLLVPESLSRWWMRYPFVVGLSMAGTVLGGVILNLTPWGLTAESWTVWLAGLTMAAAAGVLTRPRIPQRLETVGGEEHSTPRDVRLFGAAVLVTLVAIGIAYAGAVQQSTANVTQLWAVADRLPTPSRIQLGVRSLESSFTSYRLQVVGEGKVLQEWNSITLAPGEQWEASLALPPGGTLPETLEVSLYLAGDDQVYRNVTLRSLGPASMTAGESPSTPAQRAPNGA